MLGKLFSRTPATPAGSINNPRLSSTGNPESVQEDLHTQSLLFPDTQALYQHRHDQVFPLATSLALPSSATSNAFDYDCDIELEERDVRVLIMQGATPSITNTSVLYDSQVPPGLERSRAQDARRHPRSPRKSSLGHSRPVIIQDDLPIPRQTTFEPKSSINSRHNFAEAEAQRAQREYMEEINVFSSCIFANSEIMSYRGTSTKVHVVPTDTRPSEFSASYCGDGRGSLGRSSTRSSRPAQSFTHEVLSPTNPNASFSTSSSTARLPERRKVLVTRLFPVQIPGEGGSAQRTPPSTRRQDAEGSQGIPVPGAADSPALNSKPKMKKAPMYAIALVIQLPRNVPTTPSRSGLRWSNSYPEQGSFSSSFSSTRRAGWTMVGSGFGHESLDSSYGTDMEDQLEAITQHWDIIMRTLTSLQSAVAMVLLQMLKNMDLSLPDPAPNPTLFHAQAAHHPTACGRRYEDMQPKSKFNIKYIVLRANCLADNRKIMFQVEAAKARIVSGVTASRVVTGQGRWGVWRDEARSVARMYGGREEGFFFYTLLTGFLSAHTEWLQALSPPGYRRRFLEQQRSKSDEDLIIPARTIIVANDKITGRRLLFLLSAFLPASQQIPNFRPHRPSTVASAAAYSQSPPSAGVVTIVREESLRRKITSSRRTRPKQHSHNVSVTSRNARFQGVPPPLIHFAVEGGHERKYTDLSLIRQPSTPTISNDQGTRKSSAATTATVTQEPIAHFSTAHRRSDSRPTLRPGSSGSIAADDLKRSLTRCDSTGQASDMTSEYRSPGSRWGSMISGLWGPRRRDSVSKVMQTPTLSNNPTSSDKTRRQAFGNNIPPDVAQGVESMEALDAFPLTGRSHPANQQTQLLARPRVDGEHQDPADRNRGWPETPGQFEIPIRASVNAEDGVIDVDVPFPDYLTAFETAMSSPSSSGYLPTPGLDNGLDGFEYRCRNGLDGDMPQNVGGWLQEFHPDFAIQAIPPQEGLIQQVKAALRAEPTPSIPTLAAPERSMDDMWVDVGIALIADSVNCKISRVKYRRRVRPKSRGSSQNLTYAALVTPSVAPYETRLEEQFIEEEIVAWDPAFTDAVEKVISQSPPPPPTTITRTDGCAIVSGSKGEWGSVSGSSSQSAGKDRGEHEIASTPLSDAGITDSPLPLSHTSGLPPVPTEISRSQCRAVLLSCLEDLILDVAEQRKHEGKQHDQKPVLSSRDKDSVLREAVRAWLDAVEPMYRA